MVRKPLGGEKWRYDRPPDAKGEKRRQFPTDALIGVVMGHSVAVTEHEDKPSNTLKETPLRDAPSGREVVVAGMTIRGQAAERYRDREPGDPVGPTRGR